MSPSVQSTIRDAAERLREIYGDRLDQALLFGSQARGDAREASDVDVLVVLSDSGSFSLYDESKRLALLSEELVGRHREIVSFIVRPSEWWTRGQSRLKVSVQAEGVQL